MGRKLLSLLLLLCFGAAAYAEWAELLSVVVTDLNGYPAANVPVTVSYQKNRFLGLETVAKGEAPATDYGCITPVTSVSITFDPITGLASYTVVSGAPDCTTGQTYFERGNLTPANLTIGDLGTGAANTEEADQSTQTTVSSASVSITRFDLTNVDGKIAGVTGSNGIFEATIHNQVPAQNATTEYIVETAGVKRRVKYGDNRIGGKHVENFVVQKSLSLIPVQVLDGYGVPLEGAFVQMPCSDTKNGTSGTGGIIKFYTTGSCSIKASYGGFSVEQAVKVTPETVVVLNVTEVPGGQQKLRFAEVNGRAVNGSIISVTMNGTALDIAADGTANAPAGLAYGGLVTAVVKTNTSAITKGMLLAGSTRFSLPANALQAIRVPNYNNSLTVIVVDENGAPFENALVSIPGKSGQTAPDGTFLFEEVHSGTATVTAVVMGVEKKVNYTFEQKGDAFVTIEFRRDPVDAFVSSISHSFDNGCKVSIIAGATDPRMERKSDITLTLYYNSVGREESRKLLLSANGTANEVTVPCPANLPGNVKYWLTAVDSYGNYTTPMMTYSVPAAPPVTSPTQVVGKAVDELTKITGSETNALVVVTVVMVAFIIMISIAALTTLINRKKGKEMMGGNNDEPPMPKI